MTMSKQFSLMRMKVNVQWCMPSLLVSKLLKSLKLLTIPGHKGREARMVELKEEPAFGGSRRAFLPIADVTSSRKLSLILLTVWVTHPCSELP
jgi:hypothetical protein